MGSIPVRPSPELDTVPCICTLSSLNRPKTHPEVACFSKAGCCWPYCLRLMKEEMGSNFGISWNIEGSTQYISWHIICISISLLEAWHESFHFPLFCHDLYGKTSSVPSWCKHGMRSWKRTRCYLKLSDGFSEEAIAKVGYNTLQYIRLKRTIPQKLLMESPGPRSSRIDFDVKDEFTCMNFDLRYSYDDIYFDWSLTWVKLRYLEDNAFI